MLMHQALIASFPENTVDQNNSHKHQMPMMPCPPVPNHLAAMLPEFERTRLNKLREFYFQQHNDRISAFQYVRHQAMEKMNRW